VLWGGSGGGVGNDKKLLRARGRSFIRREGSLIIVGIVLIVVILVWQSISEHCWRRPLVSVGIVYGIVVTMSELLSYWLELLLCRLELSSCHQLEFLSCWVEFLSGRGGNIRAFCRGRQSRLELSSCRLEFVSYRMTYLWCSRLEYQDYPSVAGGLEFVS
jgi:hypothetical protein